MAFSVHDEQETVFALSPAQREAELADAKKKRNNWTFLTVKGHEASVVTAVLQEVFLRASVAADKAVDASVIDSMTWLAYYVGHKTGALVEYKRSIAEVAHLMDHFEEVIQEISTPEQASTTELKKEET